MKKFYFKNILSLTCVTKQVGLTCLLISGDFTSYSQVLVPFTPRAAETTPDKTNYTIKGDFTMIGNTNMELAGYTYPTNQDNANDMKYVDIDDDPNTWNSSSAYLNFSQE